ncbi:MAG: energy-coupling factor ABC transporter permease [Burkholderiaceae bacterium]
MHIEPGIVTGAKLAIGHATVAGVGLYALWLARREALRSGLVLLIARSLIAIIAVFGFFEVLPHFSAGVSEVHFIFGSTLFLMLGVAPAAIGLAVGLALQGWLLAPADLPQLAMNITTLLAPLIGIAAIARRSIAPGTRYVDLRYGQALLLSATYQAGVVAWVVFWVLVGVGAGAQTMAALVQFALAYSVVLIVEPLVDLAVLALARWLGAGHGAVLQWLNPRLSAGAA